ncbi:MAG TPA: D-2-hydroxyacid dehydrogenase [Usitatibacter sp.]|nr:D-2-hydroxyacid dehydrogenase [Usitatibacter sp.]
MRILLSRGAGAELRPRINETFAGRPFELLAPPAGLASDFDAAFVSRDVTGRSTKFEVEPDTQRFHDALRQAASLRWVHIHSAGADRPIYPELQARGVVVTTSSGANAPIVAQSALAGILALVRRLPLLMEQQRARQWKSLIGDLPRDLAGQRAAILGWGPIGRHLASWLQALGVSVSIVRSSAEPAGTHPTFAFDRLLEAAAQADWLVIACPLTERTRAAIGRPVLDAMPPAAHVVNVGRGEIVVQSDLVEALRSGKLAGAYLDVFELEPLPADSPLWSMPNVIVTPHSAGMSAGNEARVADMFIENLRRFLDGEPLLRVAAAR